MEKMKKKFLLGICMLALVSTMIIISNIDKTTTTTVKTQKEFNSEVIKLSKGYSKEFADADTDKIGKFATKTLVVNSSKNMKFSKADTVIQYNDVYVVTYKTADDTKTAFESLSKNKDIKYVDVNSVTTSLANEDEELIEDLSSEMEPIETPESFPEVDKSVANNLDTNIDITKKDKVTGLNKYIEKTDTPITVAIIDSGINTTNDRILKAIDFSGSNSTNDVSGHGTEITDIVLQNTNDNISILPIKVLSGTSNTGSVLNLYLAIKEAINQDVDVINLSVNSLLSDNSHLIEEAINEATDKGIIVIAAAGNDSVDVSYSSPSNVKSAITVSAVDASYKFAGSYSNFGELVDYSASGDYGYIDNGKAVVKNGTSYSAAYMSSAVALIKAMHPEMNTQDVSKILDEYAIDLGNTGKDNLYGNGLITLKNVDAEKIVSANYDTLSVENDYGLASLNQPADLLNFQDNWKKLTDDEFDSLILDSEYRFVYMFLSRLSEEDLIKAVEKSKNLKCTLEINETVNNKTKTYTMIKYKYILKEYNNLLSTSAKLPKEDSLGSTGHILLRRTHDDSSYNVNSGRIRISIKGGNLSAASSTNQSPSTYTIIVDNDKNDIWDLDNAGKNGTTRTALMRKDVTDCYEVVEFDISCKVPPWSVGEDMINTNYCTFSRINYYEYNKDNNSKVSTLKTKTNDKDGVAKYSARYQINTCQFGLRRCANCVNIGCGLHYATITCKTKYIPLKAKVRTYNGYGTVTVSGNGKSEKTTASAYSEIGIRAGVTVTYTAKTASENYTFYGWAKRDEDNNDYPATKSETTFNLPKCYARGGIVGYKALFAPNVYEITLNLNEGAIKGSTAYQYFYEHYSDGFSLTTGTKYSKEYNVDVPKIGEYITSVPYIPSKTNSVFIGYYGDNGIKYIDKNGKFVNINANTFSNNTTLKAHWIKDGNVTIDPNGGSMNIGKGQYTTESITREYNNAEHAEFAISSCNTSYAEIASGVYANYDLTIPGIPTINNYAFSEWKVTPGDPQLDVNSKNNTQYFKTSGSGQSYYCEAQWEPHTYKINCVNEDDVTLISGYTSYFYEKYNTSFSTLEPSSDYFSLQIPLASDRRFDGYWTTKDDSGYMVISPNGKLNTNNEAIENYTYFNDKNTSEPDEDGYRVATLYSHWTDAGNINIDANGGTFQKINGEQINTIDKYTFENIKFNSSIIFSEDKTILNNAIKKLNSGDLTQDYENIISIPVRKHYKFDGWYHTVTEGETKFFDYQTPSHVTIFYNVGQNGISGTKYGLIASISSFTSNNTKIYIKDFKNITIDRTKVSSNASLYYSYASINSGTANSVSDLPADFIPINFTENSNFATIPIKNNCQKIYLYYYVSGPSQAAANVTISATGEMRQTLAQAIKSNGDKFWKIPLVEGMLGYDNNNTSITTSGYIADGLDYIQEDTIMAKWSPETYKITLDAQGGTQSVDSFNELYNSMFCKDNLPINNLSDGIKIKPTKEDAEGTLSYTYKNDNDERIGIYSACGPGVFTFTKYDVSAFMGKKINVGAKTTIFGSGTFANYLSLGYQFVDKDNNIIGSYTSITSKTVTNNFNNIYTQSEIEVPVVDVPEGIIYLRLGSTESPGALRVVHDLFVRSNETYKIPTKKGYTFNGYFTKNELGTFDKKIINENGEIDDIQPDYFEKDTTLYAQWTPNLYEITMNANGGNQYIDKFYELYNFDFYNTEKMDTSINNITNIPTVQTTTKNNIVNQPFSLINTYNIQNANSISLELNRYTKNDLSNFYYKYDNENTYHKIETNNDVDNLSSGFYDDTGTLLVSWDDYIEMGGFKGTAESAFNRYLTTYVDYDHDNVICNGAGNELLEEATVIILPKGLTKIPDYAFRGAAKIKHIVIPDSVTKIGKYAFQRCESLQELNIPEGTTEIGWGVADHCNSLAELYIPGSVKVLSTYSFMYCDNLSKVTLGYGIKEIGWYAFGGDKKLTEIVIPNSVTTINYLAFHHSDNLIDIYYDGPVSENAPWAAANAKVLKPGFYDDENNLLATYEDVYALGGFRGTEETGFTNYLGQLNLNTCTKIYWPSSVPTMPIYAFKNSTNIKKLVLAEGVTSVRYWTFQGCSALADIYIPTTIRDLGHGSFEDCDSLISVDIPNGLQVLDYTSFYKCDNLKTVKLPNTLTTIGLYAFSGCKNLTSINIPDSVTTINEAAFNLDDISAIYYNGNISEKYINKIYPNCSFYNSIFKKETEYGFNDIITLDTNGHNSVSLYYNSGSPVNDVSSDITVISRVYKNIKLPDREGYNFMGYYTTKNASLTTYKPTQTIPLKTNYDELTGTLADYYKEYKDSENTIIDVSQYNSISIDYSKTTDNITCCIYRLLDEEKSDDYSNYYCEEIEIKNKQNGRELHSLNVSDVDYIIFTSSDTGKSYSIDCELSKDEIVINELGEIVVKPNMFDKDSTIYARWIEKRYDVTIDPAGGSYLFNKNTFDNVVLKQEFKYNVQNVGLCATSETNNNPRLEKNDVSSSILGFGSYMSKPTRYGYELTGWKYYDDYGAEITDTMTTNTLETITTPLYVASNPNQNFTAVAQWKLLNYNVVYHANPTNGNDNSAKVDKVKGNQTLETSVWQNTSFVGNGMGSSVYDKQYRFYSSYNACSVVNIQQPGFASEPGIYVIFPTAIKSCSLPKSFIEGAGIILPLSAFETKETQFTITDANGVHTCYVYWANGALQPAVEATLVSKNKTAYSSSDENYGVLAQYAFDGNTGTRWSSAATDNEWIYVDLGNLYNVNKVVLNWETARASSYNIEVSSNGTDWTLAKALTNKSGSIDTVEFDSQLARYVRMKGVKRATPYGYSLWEFEVYGTPSLVSQPNDNVMLISKGAKTSASTSENEGLDSKFVVDDDASTRWASVFGDNEWIAIDLGVQYNVSKVVLNWEAAYGKDYNIQTSTDGNNWKTVKALTGQDGGEDIIEFDATKARYVRMQGVARGTTYGYSLWEFKVYGAKISSSSSGGTSEEVTTTPPEVDWSMVDFIGDGYGAGKYNAKYKYYSKENRGSVVNIQQPGFATEPGIYVAFPTGIKSCSLPKSYIQGAGIILPLSVFTDKQTKFTVTDNDGVHTCYVYYADGASEDGDEDAGDTGNSGGTGSGSTVTNKFLNMISYDVSDCDDISLVTTISTGIGTTSIYYTIDNPLTNSVSVNKDAISIDTVSKQGASSTKAINIDVSDKKTLYIYYYQDGLSGSASVDSIIGTKNLDKVTRYINYAPSTEQLGYGREDYLATDTPYCNSDYNIKAQVYKAFYNVTFKNSDAYETYLKENPDATAQEKAQAAVMSIEQSTNSKFVGWSTNPDETVREYSPYTKVVNLTEPRGTINLYAIWDDSAVSANMPTNDNSGKVKIVSSSNENDDVYNNRFSPYIEFKDVNTLGYLYTNVLTDKNVSVPAFRFTVSKYVDLLDLQFYDKDKNKLGTVECPTMYANSSRYLYDTTNVVVRNNSTTLDWVTIPYVEGGGEYYNKYKFYCGDKNVNVVNVQQPGFAPKIGFYITFPSAILDCSVEHYVQGAGILIPLDVCQNAETKFTVTDTTGVHTCYIYNQGTGGNSSGTVQYKTIKDKVAYIRFVTPNNLFTAADDFTVNYTMSKLYKDEEGNTITPQNVEFTGWTSNPKDTDVTDDNQVGYSAKEMYGKQNANYNSNAGIKNGVTDDTARLLSKYYNDTFYTKSKYVTQSHASTQSLEPITDIQGEAEVTGKTKLAGLQVLLFATDVKQVSSEADWLNPSTNPNYGQVDENGEVLVTVAANIAQNNEQDATKENVIIEKVDNKVWSVPYDIEVKGPDDAAFKHEEISNGTLTKITITQTDEKTITDGAIILTYKVKLLEDEWEKAGRKQIETSPAIWTYKISNTKNLDGDTRINKVTIDALYVTVPEIDWDHKVSKIDITPGTEFNMYGKVGSPGYYKANNDENDNSFYISNKSFNLTFNGLIQRARENYQINASRFILTEPKNYFAYSLANTPGLASTAVSIGGGRSGETKADFKLAHGIISRTNSDDDFVLNKEDKRTNLITAGEFSLNDTLKANKKVDVTNTIEVLTGNIENDTYDVSGIDEVTITVPIVVHLAKFKANGTLIRDFYINPPNPTIIDVSDADYIEFSAPTKSTYTFTCSYTKNVSGTIYNIYPQIAIQRTGKETIFSKELDEDIMIKLIVDMEGPEIKLNSDNSTNVVKEGTEDNEQGEVVDFIDVDLKDDTTLSFDINDALSGIADPNALADDWIKSPNDNLHVSLERLGYDKDGNILEYGDTSKATESKDTTVNMLPSEGTTSYSEYKFNCFAVYDVKDFDSFELKLSAMVGSGNVGVYYSLDERYENTLMPNENAKKICDLLNNKTYDNSMHIDTSDASKLYVYLYKSASSGSVTIKNAIGTIVNSNTSDVNAIYNNPTLIYDNKNADDIEDGVADVKPYAGNAISTTAGFTNFVTYDVSDLNQIDLKTSYNITNGNIGIYYSFDNKFTKLSSVSNNEIGACSGLNAISGTKSISLNTTGHKKLYIYSSANGSSPHAEIISAIGHQQTNMVNVTYEDSGKDATVNINLNKDNDNSYGHLRLKVESTDNVGNVTKKTYDLYVLNVDGKIEISKYLARYDEAEANNTLNKFKAGETGNVSTLAKGYVDKVTIGFSTIFSNYAQTEGYTVNGNYPYDTDKSILLQNVLPCYQKLNWGYETTNDYGGQPLTLAQTYNNKVVIKASDVNNSITKLLNGKPLNVESNRTSNGKIITPAYTITLSKFNDDMPKFICIDGEEVIPITWVKIGTKWTVKFDDTEVEVGKAIDTSSGKAFLPLIHQFKVPLGIKNDMFSVKLTAYKDGHSVSKTLDIITDNSILDNIRTRIRDN